MHKKNSEFRSDINALRAIAVLSVMGFHLGVPGFLGGFSGVDVFFVISGYLISSQVLGALQRKDFSFSQFYASRLRRIVPALLVVCVTCFAFGWFMDLPKEFIRLNRHIVSAIFFVSNMAFHGERGYFDAAAETKALLHTWSLSVEGQFYLFLPLALVLLHRIARPNILWIVTLLAALSFGWTLYLNSVQPGSGFFLLSCRAWEFLVGTWLATRNAVDSRNERMEIAGVMLGVFGLVASTTWTSSAGAWPGWATLVPIISTALVIAYGRTTGNQPLFAWAPVQVVGNISYSLYLWHWPLWVFAKAWASSSGRSVGGVDMFVVLICSFVLAWISWRFVEQPIRRNKIRWSNKRIHSLYIGSAVLSFGVGLTVLANMGLPFRFGEYVRRAAEATFINTPRDECFRRGDSTKNVREQFCHMGSDAEGPSIMLWGDSHANQYQTAVSEAARLIGKGGLIATQSGCAPMFVPDSVQAVSSCQKFNHEVLSYLEHHLEIQTLVLGKWWGGGDVDMPLELVDELLRRNRKVVLVGPLPSPGFDVPDRWSRQQIRSGQPINEVVTPVKDQRESFRLAEQLRTHFADSIQKQQLVLIDPLSKLCNETQCWLVKDGRSNFRDESHLSHSASLTFTDDVRDALLRVSD